MRVEKKKLLSIEFIGTSHNSVPFSWTTLTGKHCRHPIAVMGVVDTFGQFLLPTLLI